jgi:uncharacterized protein YcbX
MKASDTAVGRVVALHTYPVKSMRGEQVPEAHLGWQGFDGDRRYAFTRTGDLSGLPWLSARECPRLVSYHARHTSPDLRRSDISVVTPDGNRMPLESPELRANIEQVAGAPVHLMHLHRGAFDAMAVSLITTRSVASLGELIECTLEPERFRANIVVETSANRAFPEDRWVGQLLLFGDGDDPARLRVNRRDKRCSVVNLDPVSGARDSRIHSAVVAARKNMLGVYGSPERPGSVALGDTVYLRR